MLHRWKGGNGPEQTDSIATGNLIRATPKGVKRFVLVTSAGVERFNKLPFSILNLFGTSRRFANSIVCSVIVGISRILPGLQ